LAESEKNILEYRQNRLNHRRLGGIDRIIAKTLPSFIKERSEEIPGYLKREMQKKGKKEEEEEGEFDVDDEV
jgi:hypothetical protein